MELVSSLVIRLVTSYSRFGNSAASFIHFYLEDANSILLRNGGVTCYRTRLPNLEGHNINRHSF